jgi:nicotinamide-nucleotide amidase
MRQYIVFDFATDFLNYMNAVILSVGDELIIGDIIDTNASYLSQQLVKCGIMPLYRETIPDQKEKIVNSIKRATSSAELIFISGGLGPTEDDLTREALAEAANVQLVLNDVMLRQLQKWFVAIKREMSESNKKQAMLPDGAEALYNPIGTAPGIKIRIGKALIFAMPGVPKELYAMVELHIVPFLKELSADKGIFIKTGVLHCFGAGESIVGEKIKDLMIKREGDVVVGTNVAGGIISIKIRVIAREQQSAEDKIKRVKETIRRRLGDEVFGEENDTLPSIVAALLKQQKKTVAVAESCTGGLLAGALTEIPGSSNFFLGGMVVYSNQLKSGWLGVPSEILQQEGAVSRAVVKILAENIIKKTSADYSLAISGIAGPDGGTPQKPVGTVWIASGKNMADGAITCREECFTLSGDRAMIRDRAVKCALNMLRREIIKS